MKRTVTALIVMLATAGWLGSGYAQPDESSAEDWKGQVSSKYISADEPFHVKATDNEAWKKAWRFKLDKKPPRELQSGEIGVLLIAGPRPTPGYSVEYSITDQSADNVAMEVNVADPDVVMYPTSTNSHPWRAIIMAGESSTEVDVEWTE